MLSHSQPPSYRQICKRERKIDNHVEWIRRVLDADRELPRKQRHTANLYVSYHANNDVISEAV